MSGAISVGAMAAMAAGALVVTQAMKPDMPKMPTAPTMPTMPQNAAAPQAKAFARNSAGGGVAGGMGGAPSGTLLTGPSGIDPNGLNLGNNMLLGE